MAIRKRGASFQADFMLGRTRHRAPFDTYDKADAWEKEVRHAHQMGKPLPAAQSNITQGGGRISTLGEILDATKRDRWSRKKSGDDQCRNAQTFVDWFGAKRDISEVTRQALYDFSDFCREKQQNSDATINRKQSSIRVMLKEAHARRIIDHIPTVEKLAEGKGTMNFLDFGQETPVINHLMHRAYDDLADLVVFLIDTGCRISEAFKVRYSTIANGYVRFEERKNGGFGTVPLSARATLAVERRRLYGRDKDRPFGDIDYWRARDRLRQVYDLLGGKYATLEQPFHIFRHSCASRLAIRGVDANRIKEWMDHSSLVVTQRYVKLAPRSLDVALAALEGLPPPPPTPITPRVPSDDIVYEKTIEYLTQPVE